MAVLKCEQLSIQESNVNNNQIIIIIMFIREHVQER